MQGLKHLLPGRLPGRLHDRLRGRLCSSRLRCERFVELLGSRRRSGCDRRRHSRLRASRCGTHCLGPRRLHRCRQCRRRIRHRRSHRRLDGRRTLLFGLGASTRHRRVDRHKSRRFGLGLCFHEGYGGLSLGRFEGPRRRRVGLGLGPLHVFLGAHLQADRRLAPKRATRLPCGRLCPLELLRQLPSYLSLLLGLLEDLALCYGGLGACHLEQRRLICLG